MATITAKTGLTYDISTIKSVNENVKSSAALDAKAGHLVFLDSTGTWVAYALTTDLSAYASKHDSSTGTTFGNYVGVLLEDVSLTTTAKNAKVAIAGDVYTAFVRSAGITAAKCSDLLLRNFSKNQTSIVFLDAKEM